MKKLWGALFHDPVDICILGYKDHPNIILILEKVSVLNLFTFLEITKTNFERRILKENPKKAGTLGNTLTKVLK